MFKKLYVRILLMFPFLLPIAAAEVVVYESGSFPEIEDPVWKRIVFCTPERSIMNNAFVVDVGPGECAPPPGGDQDFYTREIFDFEGALSFFVEFRIMVTGPSTELPGQAPATVDAASFGPAHYGFTISRDRVKLFRDAAIPLIFVDIASDVFHTYRVELTNPDVYAWYVDGQLIEGGTPEAQYPSFSPFINFGNSVFFESSTNSWAYFRFGTVADVSSGDFNSDGQVDQFEVFYIAECIERSAAGEPADPSCSWADVSGDNTVTCADWEIIKESFWTGPPANPPPMLPCGEGAIPTTSNWGLGVMALLTATAGTLFFRRYATHG